MTDVPQPNLGSCNLCGERLPSVGLLDHLRLMHPDVYGDGPQHWPDGGFVVIEDPDDLGGDQSMSRWQRVCDVLWWTWWHLGRLFDPLVAPDRYRRELHEATRNRLARLGVTMAADFGETSR